MAKKASSKSGSGGGTGDGGPGPDRPPSAPYVVLARKYRPETFSSLIGQSAMVTTLTNAFAADRIAQGYMLTGVRGVGKTTTARILARALNYARPGLPDRPTVDMPDYGIHCADIIASRHPDVIEMDAASNTGIDNVREIIESARYRPLSARYKVFIIDEVHMLSKGAFNALLKTLEEPPEHVKFIFATTEVRKVPVTVLSRCQRFDLRRVDVAELARHFQRIVEAEAATAEGEALTLIARAAEGSVRDGLSILDQAIAMGRGTVEASSVRQMLGLTDRSHLFDLAELIFAGRAAEMLAAYDALHARGSDPGQLIADLAEVIHLAVRVRVAGAGSAGDALSAEDVRRTGVIAERVSLALLSRAWQMLLKGLDEIARAPNAKTAAEMVLVRLAYTADLPAPDEIIRLLGTPSPGERRPAETGAAAERRSPNAAAASDRLPDSTISAGTPAPASPSAGTSSRPSAASAASSAAKPVARASEAASRPVPVDVDAQEDDPADTDEGGADQPASPVKSALPVIGSFEDVIRLASRKRDPRLKIALEDHVRLVAFETGRISLNLLPSAAPSLANELADKLSRWTSQRWVVAVSQEKGARPIGEVRREREAAELAELAAHPAVQAVLKTFPGTSIKEVREIALDGDDDGGDLDDAAEAH